MQMIEGGRRLGTLFQADSVDDLSAKLVEAINDNPKLEEVSERILEEIDITKHAQRVLECLQPSGRGKGGTLTTHGHQAT